MKGEVSSFHASLHFAECVIFLPKNMNKGANTMKIKRQLLNLTLQTMSTKLGITPSHLSAIERGFRNIPAHRLQEFKSAYGGSL